MFRNFSELVNQVRANAKKRVLAVAAAEDKPVIDAVLHAMDEGIADAIFVGDAPKISSLIRESGRNPSDFNVVSAPTGGAGQRAVDLVRDKSAQVLMKGLMETREFLGPIVKKENDLRAGDIMSHVVLFELPNYHKLIMHTDGGMVMYPSLEDKKHIINNATSVFRAMGYACPKHAVLCAVETLNPKMQETVDADALMRMNQSGEIRGCVVVGPISYDVAMSREIAAHKGFVNPHVGDFDALIMPNMQAGNILGKCYIVTVGAPMAGIIAGAKAPAIMTSRGSSALEKFNSIAFAAAASTLYE